MGKKFPLPSRIVNERRSFDMQATRVIWALLVSFGLISPLTAQAQYILYVDDDAVGGDLITYRWMAIVL
jgi:hypothetical protein